MAFHLLLFQLLVFFLEKILRFETERPETSSLTAHRLVAAALGMSPKLDEEKSKAEHEKLAFAKGKSSLHT